MRLINLPRGCKYPRNKRPHKEKRRHHAQLSLKQRLKRLIKEVRSGKIPPERITRIREIEGKVYFLDGNDNIKKVYTKQELDGIVKKHQIGDYKISER